MENFNQLPDYIFWRRAPTVLETLLENPVRYNNTDLLTSLPEDENPYRELSYPAPVHLKASSLDTSYKTYNLKLMNLIEKAKRFDSISDQRRLLVKTSKAFYKTGNFERLKETKDEFSVSGRKTRILMSLPEQSIKISSSLNLNTKLKEFIGKVQEKYSNLLRALEFNSETLLFEAVVEYLRKSSIMLKRPTYTRDRQRVYSQSPSISKRNQPSRYEENYSPRISEKILLLTVWLS